MGSLVNSTMKFLLVLLGVVVVALAEEAPCGSKANFIRQRDIPGHDIENYPTKHAHACFHECQRKAPCRAWTWRASDNMCLLKGAVQGRDHTRPLPGHTSAWKC